MQPEEYEKLDLEETALVLDKIQDILGDDLFDPIETTIMAAPLSFYPGYRLLDIAEHTTSPAKQRIVIYSDENQVALDFTNVPIYTLNKDVPIELSEENIADYIRFFFSHVRGRHGRFLITETVDDINWKEEPPPVARKAMSKMLKPITLKTVDDKGVFQLDATMVFKDSLFKSDISVTSDGFVNLSNEELIVEDMPVMDDLLTV